MMQSSDHKPNRYVASSLREVITQQGRVKAWLAKEAGITPGHLSNVISGARTVSEPEARQIANILGVPLFLVFELATANKDDAEAKREAIAS